MKTGSFLIQIPGDEISTKSGAERGLLTPFYQQEINVLANSMKGRQMGKIPETTTEIPFYCADS
jgi:hypothetical protein